MRNTRGRHQQQCRCDFGHTEGWSIMRRLQIRSLSLAALAFLMFGGNAAAQDKSPALLNALEVRQLVAHAEPSDHARLTGHFTALAERYTAEAKRHTSMSQDTVGNPSRNLTTGLSAHCKRLAELNTESAAAATELATYHQKLAAGVPGDSANYGRTLRRGRRSAGADRSATQRLGGQGEDSCGSSQSRGVFRGARKPVHRGREGARGDGAVLPGKHAPRRCRRPLRSSGRAVA